MNDVTYNNEGSVTFGRSAGHGNRSSAPGNQKQGRESARRYVEGNSHSGNVAEYEEIDNEVGNYQQPVPTEHDYCNIAPAAVYDTQPNIYQMDMNR